MYSDVFCKVYNEFGWNYYPEVFGQQLLLWLEEQRLRPETALDLACGTGVLCRILRDRGMQVRGMDFSSGMIQIARSASGDIPYDVADMCTYRPDALFDLVTCTGDALNHIPRLSDVEKIFQNVFSYTAPDGYFVFDLLNRNEISTSEPFEADFSETVRVWFQMTQPDKDRVALTVRVWEQDVLQLEEVIRETVHDPDAVCRLLTRCGFTVLRCADRLRDAALPGTTWFIVAKKPSDNTRSVF